jgi:hypothetical protein
MVTTSSASADAKWYGGLGAHSKHAASVGTARSAQSGIFNRAGGRDERPQRNAGEHYTLEKTMCELCDHPTRDTDHPTHPTSAAYREVHAASDQVWCSYTHQLEDDGWDSPKALKLKDLCQQVDWLAEELRCLCPVR